jgi:GNAT superfamily N-acetyltransferase
MPLVTTYLEMRDVVASRGQRSRVTDQRFEIRELTERDWKFNRAMYFKVGKQWRWFDKRPWTDEQWQEYASDPNLRTFAGACNENVAGYFELHRDSTRDQIKTEDVEIAYFGLLPEYIGGGLGGALLTSAIENAWAWSPTPSRVWVHTCNRDHPNALANYQARGFKIYKTVVG